MSDSEVAMSDDLPEWTIMEIPAYLKYVPGTEPEDVYIPYIRRGENEEPNLSPKEEERIIKEQVIESEGFDIDFKQFRCLFNYRPLNFDDNNEYVMEPETTRELMNRLSRESLERYNEKKDTKYEFVEAIKANFYATGAASVMYFITFEGMDPSNGQPKHFRARVCYYYHCPPLYISCYPTPEKKVINPLKLQ
ncbi:PREDICTED: uncharacterized protein LOC104749724 [Camelina sativa]|uniref:Uncharacterized protein LOC104749724 n=1 Tax=Camelina sativa TaxID=90675 RepID=A0ABM0WDY8_CAMSA|nr:PREDICTED: uncharacterized protein LOC104749724 [Camelina sativa]